MEDESWIRTFSRMALEQPSNDDWTLEFAEELRNSLAEPGWKTHQQTRAFARFSCSNCGHSWSSSRVLVSFCMMLGYPRLGKGSVKMYIFKQKCRRCRIFNDAIFMQQNIEITLENLLREIRKQCYRERVRGRPRDLNVEEPTTGPHERELCEACIMGVCPVGHLEVTLLQPEGSDHPVPSAIPAPSRIDSLDTPKNHYASSPWAPRTSQENMFAMPRKGSPTSQKNMFAVPRKGSPTSQKNMFAMPREGLSRQFLCNCFLAVVMLICFFFLKIFKIFLKI